MVAAGFTTRYGMACSTVMKKRSLSWKFYVTIPKTKQKKNYKKILQSLHFSKTNMHYYPMQAVIASFRLNHTI